MPPGPFDLGFRLLGNVPARPGDATMFPSSYMGWQSIVGALEQEYRRPD